jgi:hypothetical protein
MPAFVLVIIVKVIFSLQLWLLLLLLLFFFCCAFEENDDEFFSKGPLLNPNNRESKSKRRVLVFLLKEESVIKPSFFDIFLVNSRLKRKEKVKKKQLKSRSLFLSFQRYKRPVNDVNDGKQREQIRESVCV